MRITVSKDNLLFCVSAVQKAVSSKTNLPILNCIKIEAKNNRLYFTATDLEIGIQCNVPLEIIEEGATVVPARYFSEIVRRLPDVPIVLNQVSDTEMLIKYEESQLTLKTFAINDFPGFPQVSAEYEIQINAAIFKQMIKQTVFAAGSDEGRPLFTGVLFEIEENKIRMITTDTHRLALKQGEIINRQENKISCIIPAKILSELGRLMYEEEEICHININKNLVSFRLANLLIISRLLEGQFPDYRQVIPTTYNLKVIANNKKFQEGVERISLFTMLKDASNTVQIKIDNNIMVVSSQSEMGQGYEQLIIEGEGDPVNIFFNSKYLLDVFKVIEEDRISLDFTGSLSPCIIRPADCDNFIYLLLPVRA